MADENTTETPLEKDERDTPDYWKKWLKAAEKAAEDHWEKARQAWDEYECDENPDQPHGRPFQIYWASCKTLEPAYYSRTPKITTRRRFNIKDPDALTACLVAERLGQHLIESCEFDAVMQATVADFLHADKATNQLQYSSDMEPERVTLQQAGADFLGPDGMPYTEEVFQDDGGYFGKGAGIPRNQRIYLSSCQYDEILHTPEAKCEGEIRERAYYFMLNKDEAEKRFGPEKCKGISWKSKKDDARKTTDAGYQRDKTEAVGKYVEGWECWSKPNRKVYWLSKQYSEGFLDEKADPYQLKDFFPSPPFIIGSKPSKSLYPTPVYARLRPLIEQLHTAADKVTGLIDGIRRRALVDGANEDVLYALNSAEGGEFVAVQNLTAIVEKGGVENLVWYIPVQELTAAITELSSLQDKFKNEFYEWFGVPDILRGATEPMESASAQQLKAESAHDRFKWQKKLVAQLARDSIEMMVDLALGVFTDDTIAEICGYAYMDPADQQRFPAALAMLRNDQSRMIRIEIESDSMSFVDEQMRAQQTAQAVEIINTGLQSISQVIQTSPEYAAVGLHALLLSLEGLAPGREFSGEIKQAVEGLIEKAKNPPEPAPPPPDYEAMKLQVAQQKLQLDSQRDQMNAQIQTRELDRKEYELQLKAGTEQANVQIEQMRAQLEQTVQQFMMQLEAQRLEIEGFKAQMQARESEMEEIRLAGEAETERYRAAVETAQTEKPESVQPPVINVINTQQPAAAAPVMPILPLG